ncbi:septum formation initiator family protein [Anaerovoracaceae bacterium 42-11]|nr:septum formation initiator family protein [Emergencia sp.]
MKKRKKGRVKQFADAEVRKSETESTAGTVRKKKRVKVNQGRLILTVIVVILIAVVGMSVKNVFDLRAEQKNLQEKNQNLLQQQDALKAELENVNDLEYIEEQARIQLRMIKPGEILFVLDKEQDKDNNDGTDQEDN